jgi:hypothetical protein
MHDGITHYEFVLVYVNGIMFTGRERQNSLLKDHGFKLKGGAGPPKYPLDAEFYRDSDGTVAWVAHSYVSKVLKKMKPFLLLKPKECATPND